jgi:uncharacterized repeat protein (TIGR01451 family)
MFGFIGMTILALPIQTAYAAPSVRFRAMTPFAVVDSNNCTTAGPMAMYVQVVITNTGASALSNATATINSFSNGSFSLAGGQSPSIYIGNLAAGAATNVFWYVHYPSTAGSCNTVQSTTYTVSITDGSGTTTSNTGNTDSVPLVGSQEVQPSCASANTMCLDTRGEQSASAGGQVYNATLGPGVYAGQLITYTVTYDFGNSWTTAADAIIEPAGNTTFNAACYQLLGDTIDSSAFDTTSNGMKAGQNNQLYFPSVSSSASSVHAQVTYTFRVLCAGIGTTTIDPYSDLTSGHNNNKYTGNYAAGTCTSIPCSFTIPDPSNPLNMQKTVSQPSVVAGGSLVYTVTVANTSTVPVLLDRITDTLPIGQGGAAGTVITYTGTSNAGFVKASNSSFVPTGPITNTGPNAPIHWLSIPNSTWSIPANSSINVVYTATWSRLAPDGNYQNTACAQTGNVALGCKSNFVTIGNPAAVTLSSMSATAEETTPNLILWASALGGIMIMCAVVGRWTERHEG